MIRAALFVVLLTSSIALAAEPKTVAESSNYQATSTSQDVSQFAAQLAEQVPHVVRSRAGQTVEARDIELLIVANPPVSEPSQLAGDARLVVLLLGNIHSGECAGKEALLEIARELALDAEHKMLEHVVFLIAPNYNADANDRVGKEHRSRQAGPAAGCGLRENAQGLDLNRDFTKLDAPETRGLVKTINDWNPHLFIDTHTTNGSFHRYDLTFSGPRNPLVNEDLRSYVNDIFLGNVKKRCLDRNVATFEYGNFDPAHKVWTTFGPQGRYSTEYVGLRGRIGILSEAYAYKTYERRIEASRVFVRSCIETAIARKDELRKLLDNVAENASRQEGDGSISLRSKLKAHGSASVAGFKPNSIDMDHYKQTKLVKGEPQDFPVKLMTRYESSESVTMPRAYVLRGSEVRVADRLLMHGIQVERVLEDATAKGHGYTIKKVTKQRKAFQGRRSQDLEIDRKATELEIREGDFVVRCNQPLSPLAAYLLEPRSEDGLAHWGFFDGLAKGVGYPVLSVTDGKAVISQRIERVVPTKRLTLDMIYGPEKRRNFSGVFPTGLQWREGEARYNRNWAGRKVQVDAATGAQTPLKEESTEKLEQALLKLEKISKKDAKKMAGGGTKSPQKDAVLISHANDLFYHRTGQESAVRLTNTKGSERFATFSADGKQVAFVRDQTLFVVDVETAKETRLTEKGSTERLFGQLDWVYQEEIYGRGKFKAFWWSPDSSRIAFLRLDEKPVGRYTVADNIPVRQNLEVTRYPKSGDPLPHVALGVVEIDGGKTWWIEPESKKSDEPLIVRVGWDEKGGRVIYQTQNRRQTELTLFAVSATGGEPQRLIHEDAGAWVNVLGEPTWLEDGAFLWLSERSGYKHLYHVSADGGQTRAVTKGDWNIERLLGVDKAEEWVYFTGGPDWPRESQVYRVALAGGEPQRLTDKKGNHAGRFNDDFTFFFDYYSQAGQPTKADLRRADGTYVRTIEPNLTDRLSYYEVSKPEFFTVKARDGVSLNATVIKPPNFDPSKKYPVLCYVYSGPQAPTVRNRWGGSTYLWHQMLAQQGYVIWSCDNRSAGGTAKHAWPIYGDLGKEELKDIEDGLGWLKQQSWVDNGRIGIWGWSYGGYMTSYALTHSKSFSVGIAGAPVTDWKNYDAVYTERYMDLPQNNKKGYESSSAVRAAKNLQGRLLLLHGTIDDNVHLSNSLQFASALQNARRPFEMMFYPKSRHSVHSPNLSRHLKDLMTRFILENL